MDSLSTNMDSLSTKMASFSEKLDPCNPNPDMQGFAVRLAIFLTHSGMAFLLKTWTISEDPYGQIRMCFYAFFFQFFPIFIGTLVSFIQRKISPGDAQFALLMMLSPTTLELLDLLPINFRRIRKWNRREIRDGISIILLLGLTTVLYATIIVFLSREDTACPLHGFYDPALWGNYSGIGYYATFAVALLTVYLTIFRIPGYQTMKFLLQVLLWSPAMGFEAFMIITIVFSILDGMQIVGATRAKCVVIRWRLQIADSPHFDSRLLPILQNALILGRLAMAIAIFADPRGVVIWIAIVFSLLGELAVKFPVSLAGASWIRISASWIYTMSEAADRIHPQRGSFLSAVFYAQWGLALRVTTLEPNYQLTYGQIVASLSFLPIATECLKLAFQEHHRLGLRSLRLAIFPLWPNRYKKLSDDEVYPKEFWETKTRTAVVASILGLTWAGCLVPDRLPAPTRMRPIVYSAYPSIRFPEVLEDDGADESADSNSGLNRHHKPIEMKTMPLSALPTTPDSSTTFLNEKVVEEPGSFSDTETEETVVIKTGRENGMRFESATSPGASLPHPVTTPRRRTLKAVWRT